MKSYVPNDILKEEEPQELSCGVLLFNPRNEVLLLRHAKGHWAFPKGHKEADEADPETALRELYEETGLDAVILQREDYRTHYSPEPGVLKQVRYFIAQPSDPDQALQLQTSEISDGDWLDFAGAQALLTFDNDKQLLETVYNEYLSLRVHENEFRTASLLANTLRPVPADLPVTELQTPAFVVDTRLLEDNLRLLASLREETSCKILLAQKAYSLYNTYPLIGRYLDGTTGSGLHEAKLGSEEMPGKEVHVFSPAYKAAEMEELVQFADHLVFNTFDQWNRFRSTVEQANEIRREEGRSEISCGLRINPEHSTGSHDIYNPAAPGSRLGIPRQSFVEGVEHFGLEGIDGLHFHTLCEENSDALAETWESVKKNFDPWLQNLKWINFGGGHHITRADYDLDLLRAVIRDAQETYGVTVYLEPGEAVVLNCGWLVTEVQDLFQNQISLAIVDTSATCHMPDVLEMPYQPLALLYHDGSFFPTDQKENSDENPYLYRLGGPTCLAGDVIGDYAFPRELDRGDRIVFCDMALYTMVKTNTFNGMPLPSIYLFGEAGLQLEKTFGYEDFKSRLGG